MKSWLILIFFFSEGLFFGTLALFSKTHTEESSAFAFYILVLAAVIGFAWFITFMKKSISKVKEIQIGKLVIVSLLFFIALNLVFRYLYSGSEIVLTIIRYFVALVIPGALISLSAKEKDILNTLDKIRVINIYLSICFLIAFLKNSSGSISAFSEIGGATHLTIGYTMAALFPYNYMKLTTNKGFISKVLHLLLIVLNISLILFSGSRGAMLSVMVNFVVITYLYVIKRRKTFRYLIGAIPLFIIGIPWINRMDLSDALSRFALTFSGDIETASAGRSFIYHGVMRMISESPLFGNGVAAYSVSRNFYIFPHQLFLEVLNDFGILGLGMLLGILVVLFRKVFWILKQDDLSKHLIVFLFLNIFTSLMISGSYLVNMQLWVVMVLIVVMKRNEKANIRVNELSDTIATKQEHLI